MADFELAKDKVMMGAERRSMVISEHEKKRTAWHEAGHTLVGLHAAEPRPGPQGVDHPARSGAGRDHVAAEGRPPRLLHATGRSTASRWRSAAASPKSSKFGAVTTGASDDFKQATQLARAMVTEWGMSEKLGPDGVPRARRDPSCRSCRACVAATTRSRRRSEIDAEVHRIITEQYSACARLCEDNMDKLERDGRRRCSSVRRWTPKRSSR